MAKNKKKKKLPKKMRDIVVLGMILHCKAGKLKDKRVGRGGNKNLQSIYLDLDKF